MADKVKSTPGAIGYVEYQYAVKDNISQIAVQNQAGKFVKASPQSMIAACEAAEAPGWKGFSASLINASGAESFPLTSFSWIYLKTKSSDATRASALSNLLEWIYSDGQQFAAEENYTELPSPLLAALRERVKELQ